MHFSFFLWNDVCTARLRTMLLQEEDKNKKITVLDIIHILNCNLQHTVTETESMGGGAEGA